MGTERPLGVVELLTLYTMTPLLFASIYGMNIRLPFQSKPWAFGLFVTACLVWFVLATVFVLLRRRHVLAREA